MMWKVIRYYRQLCIWLRIRHHQEHTAFKLPEGMTAKQFYRALIPLGYQSITFPYCHIYPGQIFSVRRLVGVMQYHGRFWSDNTFTLHYEHNFEFNIAKHMRGEDVTDNGPEERQRILDAVTKFLEA